MRKSDLEIFNGNFKNLNVKRKIMFLVGKKHALLLYLKRKF